MTEEIIIDGVDVAGCYFYYKGECHCELDCIDTDKGETIEELFYRPEHNYIECEPSKNCYYKQFKRLQEKYDTLTNKFLNAETDKTRLEQENKELKELNKKICEDWTKEIEFYWNTFKEIKNKAENLYYKAITDPVKREKEIRNIREICNEVLNDK